MTPLGFLFLFTTVVLLVLYFVFRQKINIILFPARHRYILMKSTDEVVIFPLNIRNKYKFEYRKGVYYLEAPEKIREIVNKELVKKENEGKNEHR